MEVKQGSVASKSLKRRLLPSPRGPPGSLRVVGPNVYRLATAAATAAVSGVENIPAAAATAATTAAAGVMTFGTSMVYLSIEGMRIFSNWLLLQKGDGDAKAERDLKIEQNKVTNAAALMELNQKFEQFKAINAAAAAERARLAAENKATNAAAIEQNKAMNAAAKAELDLKVEQFKATNAAAAAERARLTAENKATMKTEIYLKTLDQHQKCLETFKDQPTLAQTMCPKPTMAMPTY